MTKNLKKCLNLLRKGVLITKERFPTNYEKTAEIFAKEVKTTAGIGFDIYGDAITEVDFHQARNVEKEQA